MTFKLVTAKLLRQIKDDFSQDKIKSQQAYLQYATTFILLQRLSVTQLSMYLFICELTYAQSFLSLSHSAVKGCCYVKRLSIERTLKCYNSCLFVLGNPLMGTLMGSPKQTGNGTSLVSGSDKQMFSLVYAMDCMKPF